MRRVTSLAAVVLFVFGTGVGLAAKRQPPVDYRSMSKEDAAAALLARAEVLSMEGSWERIAIGRVYYLSGAKPQGQAIFDAVLQNDPESGDLIRIGRIYLQAGEWPRAKALFDRALQLSPKEERDLAEVDAIYLLNDDRATSETLFDRSQKVAPDFWATVIMAGAFRGVPPQE